MFSFFMQLNYSILALIFGIITFLITVAGAALVYFFNRVPKKNFDILMSLSVGIMLSSTIFSLIEPCIKFSENLNYNPVLIITIGILIGSILLYLGEKYLFNTGNTSNLSVITGITLHNIPEGLAIGVAFGSLSLAPSIDSLSSAIILAIGIGIQNFPEGMAISLPLKKSGYSTNKSFLIGTLTALPEPIAALIGAIVVTKYQIILPLSLALAAGAMLYIIIIEMVPESQNNEKKELMGLVSIVGFCIMMVLDLIF